MVTGPLQVYSHSAATRCRHMTSVHLVHHTTRRQPNTKQSIHPANFKIKQLNINFKAQANKKISLAQMFLLLLLLFVYLFIYLSISNSSDPMCTCN